MRTFLPLLSDLPAGLKTVVSTRPHAIVTPVLRDTLYDRVSSWVIALFVGVGLTCFCVIAIWFSNRIPQRQAAVPVEMIELAGGFEDGAPDETLRVDSPEPEARDAAPSEMNSDQVEISEALEAVVELSENATQQVQQQFDTGSLNTGKSGSAKGTGRRGLGVGPGSGGMPRDQRWFVLFGDNPNLDEYARQLDFFGIELGAVLPDGRLAYLSKIAQTPPEVNYANSGEGEARLFMTWQGGNRRSADVDLFKRVNLDLQRDTLIFHFYSKATESDLAQREREYRNRPVREILRTYFSVQPAAVGYQFTVTRQTYFQ